MNQLRENPDLSLIRDRGGYAGTAITATMAISRGQELVMSDVTERPPFLPPRWVIVTIWRLHRGLFRVSKQRRGLWPPGERRWGTMRLVAIGRRTGQERPVILAYYEDGPNLVTIAMNGWGPEEPLWWLNLQAHPEVRVQLHDGPRQVVGRAAAGEERTRLWERWRTYDKKLDAMARRRPNQTAVVVLEPAG